MRVQDIVIGKNYRIKTHPLYCYAKAVEVLRPKQGVNTNTYSVIKCHYSVDVDAKFALIKYFKPSALAENNK